MKNDTLASFCGVGKFVLIALVIFVMIACVACAPGDDKAADIGSGSSSGSSSGTDTGSAGTNSSSSPKVQITMADGATIDVELDAEAAPITVENFLKLVEEGFYDGLTFHRVVSGFMIQGGDPLGTGGGGSDEPIKGEFGDNGWNNPISHKRGVISMARKYGQPDSATSQFFIVHRDSASLDGQYAAFGHVTSGMEEVDKIAQAETDANDKPLQDIVIESIKVIR